MRTAPVLPVIGHSPGARVIVPSGYTSTHSPARTAATADVIQEFLATLHFTCEVLGFTTSKWKGGRSPVALAFQASLGLEAMMDPRIGDGSGVALALDIIRKELAVSLALTGCNDIRDASPDILFRE